MRNISGQSCAIDQTRRLILLSPALFLFTKGNFSKSQELYDAESYRRIFNSALKPLEFAVAINTEEIKTNLIEFSSVEYNSRIYISDVIQSNASSSDDLNGIEHFFVRVGGGAENSQFPYFFDKETASSVAVVLREMEEADVSPFVGIDSM